MNSKSGQKRKKYDKGNKHLTNKMVTKEHTFDYSGSRVLLAAVPGARLAERPDRRGSLPWPSTQNAADFLAREHMTESEKLDPITFQTKLTK
jgi:hypothetical protein